jgi:unsaturated rhamnogalacturonyl hydrolase
LKYEIIDKLKKQYMSSKKWYSPRWHYIEACILKSYLDSYAETGKVEYYKFVKDFIDSLYDKDGNITGLKLNYYSIDQIRMGTILFKLYETEKDEKYKNTLDSLYKQLKTYPRTESGSFWHKENYPNQIWLDGLYMGQPFYVQYIKEFEPHKDYSDTFKQFENARKFLYNEKNHLYYHAYDESRESFWCDKVTGRSQNVWGRAAGWITMALVDIIELLDGEIDTKELKALFQEVVDGMLPYQHNSGMWYQIVDMGDKPGNYLESSGTLMLSYGILKGVRLGYLPEKYATYGKAAFDGTINQYVRQENEEVLLGGICKSAGLGKNPDTGIVRDGSFEYYTKCEKVVDNNGHGVAPLLMAYNEIQLI